MAVFLRQLSKEVRPTASCAEKRLSAELPGSLVLALISPEECRLASREERYLADIWDRNLCPRCGQPLPSDGGYGSGRRTGGKFCSLVCFGRYHEMTLGEKARLFRRAAGSGNGAH